MSNSYKYNKPTVIFVHGTFAASNEDIGSSWWQKGSSFDEQISEKITKNISGEIITQRIHWDGKNSERSRLHGAEELLKELEGYERCKTHYHLIGHSHGGTVIWETLKLSVTEKISLRHLKSWATVGTPFIQKTYTSNNLARSFFIMPAIFTVLLLFASLGTLLLPDSDIELLKFFERYPLVAISVFVISIFLVPILSSLGFSNYFMNFTDKKAEIVATRKFLKSWLGLYSEDDEAINVLTVAASLHNEAIIPRKSHGKVLPFERNPVGAVSRICTIPFYWFFNTFIAQGVDKFFWSQMKQSAFGDNCPGIKIQGVSNAPSSLMKESFPLLEKTSSKIKKDADKHMSALTPKLRTMLSDSALDISNISNILNSSILITGEELIHTSYFSNEDVTTLLVYHIKNMLKVNNESEDKDLSNWLNGFYKGTKKAHIEHNDQANKELIKLKIITSFQLFCFEVGMILGGLLFLMAMVTARDYL